MSKKLISCGGFEIDNETLVEEDGVLKVIGGETSGATICPITLELDEHDAPLYTATIKASVLWELAQTNVVIGIIEDENIKYTINLLQAAYNKVLPSYGFYFGNIVLIANSDDDYPATDAAPPK